MNTLPPPVGPRKRVDRLPVVTFSDGVDYDGFWSLLSDTCVEIHMVDGSVSGAVIVGYRHYPMGVLVLLDVETEEPKQRFNSFEDIDEFSDRIATVEYL